MTYTCYSFSSMSQKIIIIKTMRGDFFSDPVTMPGIVVQPYTIFHVIFIYFHLYFALWDDVDDNNNVNRDVYRANCLLSHLN